MSEQRDTMQQRTVSFKQAARFWLKLGFISFGGPAGQIAIMHRELVERRKWISEERFLHALNFCMLLPGPEAQQLATYTGWLLHKTPGGVVAGALFVLPSVFILLGLSYIYAAHGDVPAVAAALDGIKPVVVAIVIEAVIKVGKRALKTRAHIVIAMLSFAAIHLANVPFPLIILLAAGAGFVITRFAPDDKFELKKHDASPPESQDTAPLKSFDEASDAAHTQPGARRAIQLLLVFFALWLLPFIVIAATRGTTSLHARQYVFFTQTAFITFGGAYAVLAYVTQRAVEDFAWINQAQSIDGLALAETTPGPLIMVLQFIGFVAAWNNSQGMTQTSSAILGALLTTYATFLPGFMFVFLGAPYIERLRGNRNLTAALSGVTAAVVGVILSLALTFGASVIFPHSINVIALISTLVAFLLLYKFKISVVWIILLGGASGLMLSLI